MSVIDEYFTTTLSRDLYNIVCGKKIGSGIGRKVFTNRLDPTTVIKIETRGGSFQNIMEWEVWDYVKGSKAISAWFAPCVAISPSGLVLVQKRTAPARERDFPRRVPKCFTDMKRENWGFVGNKLVCHDYGYIASSGITTKTKKAVWW